MTRVIKIGLVFVFTCFLGLADAQVFEAERYELRKSWIDSLMAAEAYHEAITHLEDQLSYLQQSQKVDSVNAYVYNLGMAYLYARGTDAAIKRIQKITRYIEQSQPDKSKVLDALNKISKMYSHAGQDSLSMETNLTYVAVCKSYADATPVEKSTGYYNLGTDYNRMGHTKDALFQSEMALKPVLHDSVKYADQFLNCLNILGACHIRNGTYKEAKSYLHRGINFIESLTDADERWEIKTLMQGNLSYLYQIEGDLLTAKSLVNSLLATRLVQYEKVEDEYNRAKQQRILIIAYHSLSAINLMMGDLTKSYALVKYEDELKRKWLPEGHPGHFKSYESIGSVQLAMGMYDEAMHNFEKYLEFAMKNSGRYSYYTGIAYQRIAKVAIEKGDFQKAVDYCTEAIEIEKAISDEYGNLDLAHSYMHRAMAYAKLNQYAEAEADVRKVKVIFENIQPPESPIFNKLLNIHARLKKEQNQLDSANYLVDESLKNLRTYAEANDGKRKSHAYFFPEAFELKADIVLSDGGDEKTIKEALEYLEQGMEWVLTTQHLFSGQSSVLSLFDDNLFLFDKAKSLYNELLDITGDPQYINRIYQTDEAYKTVIMRQQLSEITSLQTANVPDSVLQAEREYRDAFSELSSEMPSLDDIGRLEKNYEALQEKIAKEYPDYFALRYSHDVASTHEIQTKLLKPKQSLIKFMEVHDDLFALILTQSSKNFVKLNAGNYEEKIDSLNRAIVKIDQSRFLVLAQELYTRLFEPLIPHFGGNELFIIPTGKIANLNFEVLVDPMIKTPRGFVLQKYTVSYLLSGTTALQYHNIEQQTQNNILSFAPGFSDETKEYYRASLTRNEWVDEEYFYHIQQPFAVSSALNVVDLFSGKAFVAQAATEKNFKSQATDYQIIHLGTHTQINNVSPLLSRLVFTKDTLADDDENDGYLHAYEIYNMQFRAELAVLTACETGVGQYSSSEGVRSLAHSFAYAGCPSIVMSLWQIDEQTSSQIIEGFYSHLARGMAKNKALRQAKLDYLTSHHDELLHPYYWSGMVLVGDAGALNLKPGKGKGVFLLFAVAALIAIWLFAGKRG